MSRTYRKHDRVRLLQCLLAPRGGVVLNVLPTDDERDVYEILVDGVGQSVLLFEKHLRPEQPDDVGD